MANLYRKPEVRKDPVTGEKIKSKSKKWWGQYKDADGRLRRHPLATDKKAAQAMLNDLVKEVEREKAGLLDPTDKQRKRPLKEHVTDFQAYLENKGVSEKQVYTVVSQVTKIAAGCKWKLIPDINATAALAFLGDLRRQGRSAQTYNNYLQSVKQFSRWLVRDRRTPTDPLAHLSKLNVKTDRRHDRRALSADEFDRLVEAARHGKSVESISGEDRVMLYTLAAWTGFRKGEIGSLTTRSLNLDGDPPTVTVAACFSKHRREDRQVLQLRLWLHQKRLSPTDLLFPVSGRVPGGTERKTNKMMKRDLAAARKVWIAEAKTKREKAKREATDFLSYENHDGLFADFHSCRHLFITSLERAGISPKMAQILARHSDIRLTMNVYTHTELADQTAAIAALPGPSKGKLRVVAG